MAVRVVGVDPTGGPRVVLGAPKAQDPWAQPQKLPSRFEAEKGQIGRWRAQDPDQEAPHFFHDAPVHHGLGHALQAFLFLAHSEFVVGTAHHNQTSRSLWDPGFFYTAFSLNPRRSELESLTLALTGHNDPPSSE